MKALQFDRFGAPDVIAVRDVPAPEPGPGQIRVAVHACGLNPADWGLVDGLGAEALPPLPRGIGLEVSGVVDALGAGVTDVAVGDQVLGPPTYDGLTAGAAERAILANWTPVPDGLDLRRAAALPMAAETAHRGLDDLGARGGELVLVHGAGGVVGAAAVYLAVHRGARVIATAGPARADELQGVGAQVTPYGDGMAERVRALAGGPVDRALDASPVGGSLPVLVELTGDPDRVLTLADFAAAEGLGARASVGESPRYGVLEEVVGLAAAGSFVVPIARTFALEQVAEAARLSQSGRPGGKLLLLI